MIRVMFVLVLAGCAGYPTPKIEAGRCEGSLRDVSEWAQEEPYVEQFKQAVIREAYVQAAALMVEAANAKDSAAWARSQDTSRMMKAVCEELDGLTAEEIAERSGRKPVTEPEVP